MCAARVSLVNGTYGLLPPHHRISHEAYGRDRITGHDAETDTEYKSLPNYDVLSAALGTFTYQGNFLPLLYHASCARCHAREDLPCVTTTRSYPESSARTKHPRAPSIVRSMITNALSRLTKEHTPEHYFEAIVFAAPYVLSLNHRRGIRPGIVITHGG